MKLVYLLYGIVSYFVFFGAFVYAALFVGNIFTGTQFVPKTIDTGEPGAVGASIVINVLLLALFAIQHTIMARPAFKAWWTKICPPPIERSTFVLVASLILVLVYWQWRPMPEIVWDLQNAAARNVLWALYAAGWGIVLFSSFLIDHFDLFGLRQVYLNFVGKEYGAKDFKLVSLYKLVRHPLMVGFLIAFWAAPTMTQGHLLWSIVTTGYIFVGVLIEERDLAAILGDDYVEYQKSTRMFIPIPKGKPTTMP